MHPKEFGYRSLNTDDHLQRTENRNFDIEHDENTNLIMYEVQENQGHWTHIEDLDSFFTRMYHYYLKGGFMPMVIGNICEILQHIFVVYFVTILIYCINYPILFGEDITNPSVIGKNVTLYDIFYPQCSSRISFRWWVIIMICCFIGIFKITMSMYTLYHAYNIKLFYNNALEIQESDISLISWSTVLDRVKKAQQRIQMCIHKDQISELDVYQRILRYNNYFVAMVNKNILPIDINIPMTGSSVPYLSKWLKYNLELLLFNGPWSPWENCWHLKDSFKDPSRRDMLAKELRKSFTIFAVLNIVLFPLIQMWQLFYYFFNYAELIRRSPETLGLRTWSLYSQVSLRHFNELDHELRDRLHLAYKPAMKYLNSIQNHVVTAVARTIAFISASVLGVLLFLSIYDEIVLTVEHMLTVLTGLGVILACARALMPEEGTCQRSSEELLVHVLSHVHYLPPNWKGRAHTKAVVTHFANLFQYKAIYLLMELMSPIVCPYILLKLRNRSLEIVDFYTNFTVNVLGIGDICSFSQMDIKQHGNPDWSSNRNVSIKNADVNVSQYHQAEDGKTELSLVAFSCRNPAWNAPLANQRQYLQSLREGIQHVTTEYMTNTVDDGKKSMLNSFFDQCNMGAATLHDLSLSHHHRIFTRTDEEKEEAQSDDIVPDKIANQSQETLDISISALHLYDLHNAKRLWQSSYRNCAPASHSSTNIGNRSSEDTPLLKKN